MHEESILNLVLESNLINFSVAIIALLWFLTKFLPKASTDKKQELEQEIAHAKKAKEEAEAKLKTLEMEIERAKAEAQQIVNNAKAGAENIKTEIVEQAKQDVERMNANAAKEIDQQKAIIIQQIKEEVSSQALEIIEKKLAERKADLNSSIQTKLNSDLEKVAGV